MNKRIEWLLLILLAAGGIFLWSRLALPRYQAIDLSVKQARAVEIAKTFLTQHRVNIQRYHTTVSFNVDESADRYLQKTLGIAASRDLVHHLHYDLFFWVVRFFRERQKEEFKIAISSATGEIIGVNHIIPDTAPRPLIDKDKARQIAVDFLQKSFGFNFADYTLHAEEVKKYDNRQDYIFSWQNKDVDIPWNKSREKGHAKLLTNVTVAGAEILDFAKYQFEIPDGFNRYVDNLKQTGQNLTLIFRLLYLALLTIAIVVVVNRKQQVVAAQVKLFYCGIGVGIFVLMTLDMLNSYQSILFDYPTTQSLGNFLVRQLIEGIIGPFFIAVAFVLPAIGGESLRFEVAAHQKHQSFLSPLLSSFCSAAVGRQIVVGYLAAGLILGLQALIFNLGYKYCGVWDELSWMTQSSTAVLPALTALAIGFQASFSEEAMFRLFAINLLKKYGVPTAAAVFLAAATWGFGHTGYDIYPMWFRGIEVTSIGILMGIFYLRFGFITVLAAHFLIDAFLSSLPYLLRPNLSLDFCSSCAILVLPLLFTFIAFIFDRRVPEQPLKLRFNGQQHFNYQLLMELCQAKTPAELAVLKKDLQRHGWDEAIIQRVFEEERSGS